MSKTSAEKHTDTGLPVMLLSSPWLLPSSWRPWEELLEQEGFKPVVPTWPDGLPKRPHEKLKSGRPVAELADHLELVARSYGQRPAIIGHCFGGLLAEILASRGAAAVTVAISPAPLRGVLPLPFTAMQTARSTEEVTSNGKAVPLTFEQFRQAFGNKVSGDEARHLFEHFAIPPDDSPLFDDDGSKIDPWTEVSVETVHPQRGPLLIIAGGDDHVVPPSVAKSSFHLQRRNAAPTEFVEIAGKAHSLTIDQGWQEVAELAVGFIRRYAPSRESHQ